MWTRFMCAFFNGEHPLTVSEQSQEVLSEIKCCNYQILCSLKMALKLKLSKFHIKCTLFWQNKNRLYQKYKHT